MSQIDLSKYGITNVTEIVHVVAVSCVLFHARMKHGNSMKRRTSLR